MTSLVLMYVYYDNEGDIKAISPTPDISHKEFFNSATFPLTEVESFLTGMRNPFDYSIKEFQRAGSKSFRIARKVSTISLTRTLDNYLTRVDNNPDEIPTIQISINLIDKNVRLRIDEQFVNMHKIGTEEEQEDAEAFIKSGLSSLYVTKKNDPYSRLFTIIFSPKELFEKGNLYFAYDETLDFSNASVYTKKIVKNYGFTIRGK